MQALLSVISGGPDTLQLKTLPDLVAGNDEIVIEVQAAGVNFPDTLMIRDLYQMKPPRPFAPGGEVSGTVLSVGDDVDTVQPGDRVLALTGHGGFASQVATKAVAAVKIPDLMPFDEAACFVFTYGTSYHALHDRADLKAGETLLVLGAAGGVGSAAIELGKAMGARVIAAVSSEEKATFCQELGADETIVYPREMDRDAQKSLSSRIKSLTNGGVDVVYDAVGGDYAEPALRSLSWKGRFLVVGFPAGIPKIPLNLTLLKGCQIVGVFWGASVLREPQSHARNMNDLFAFYEAGKIRPRISARYPLKRAKEALEMLESRSVLGKVVVLPGAE